MLASTLAYGVAARRRSHTRRSRTLAGARACGPHPTCGLSRNPRSLIPLLPPPPPFPLNSSCGGGQERRKTTEPHRQGRDLSEAAVACPPRRRDRGRRKGAACRSMRDEGQPPPPRGARRTRAYVSEWASGRLAAIKPVPDGVFLPRRRAREKDGAGASNGVLRRAPRACRWLACVNVILRPRLRARLWICGFQL